MAHGVLRGVYLESQYMSPQYLAFGDGRYAILTPHDDGHAWAVSVYEADGTPRLDGYVAFSQTGAEQLAKNAHRALGEEAVVR